jgi:hypothetical protein
MSFLRTAAWFAGCLSVFVVCSGVARATDIGGTISTTLTIKDDSQLVDDVTCTVTGAPCIVIGAPNITLELNGFTMTGQADPQSGCGGSATGSEFGILVNAQTGATIHGPGLVQQFRNTGIQLLQSSGVRVIRVTTSTNCTSGILVAGGGNNEIDRNVSVRNGNGAAACGGI